VAGLINRVLHSKLKNATHWSVRSVAEETAIFKSTVARYFALFGLQPHRSKSFRLLLRLDEKACAAYSHSAQYRRKLSSILPDESLPNQLSQASRSADL
jgi:hypothetical protein